tara:strand:- start:2881 stop:3036 length:156 start_codon:yes stop_codon:yes gene_type:complete
MSKAHNLKQTQAWARENKIGKWMYAYDVQDEKPRPKPNPKFNKQNRKPRGR